MSTQQYSVKSRGKSPAEQDGRTVVFPVDVVEGLMPHAARRNLTVNALARRLIETIVDDGMVDAILDDEVAARREVRVGDLTLYLNTKAADVSGKPLTLTGKEYQVLELLALRKGRTLTKEAFLDHLYGGIDEPDSQIIDVFICRLRKKLAAAGSIFSGIETVRGRGYTLCERKNASAAAA